MRNLAAHQAVAVGRSPASREAEVQEVAVVGREEVGVIAGDSMPYLLGISGGRSASAVLVGRTSFDTPVPGGCPSGMGISSSSLSSLSVGKGGGPAGSGMLSST